MIVYRTSDRIPVQINGLKFLLSPLSFAEKTALLSCVKMQGGKEVVDGGKRAFMALKLAVKGVEGLSLADGSAFPISFDGDGHLADSCVDDLLQLDECIPLAQSCTRLLNGPLDIAKVEGVTVDYGGVINAQKKD
jgi:hypothetical protein